MPSVPLKRTKDQSEALVVPTITNLKSVQLEAMLENVIDAVALPKVVVAIGSYVIAIYAPVIPYSEKTVPSAKLAEV